MICLAKLALYTAIRAIDPEPRVAAAKPVRCKLKAGKLYWYCRCEESPRQPFCNLSHIGTRHLPKAFKPETTGEAWLCQCKQTRNPPYCDGSHKALKS